jgi:hypothetical protein
VRRSPANSNRFTIAFRSSGVAFSWDDETKLGGRIFNTAQPVHDYVVERILAAAARH